MADYFLGLDLGGTNIKAGIVNAAGKLLHSINVPTGRDGDGGEENLSPNAVIRRMAAAGERVIAEARVPRKSVAAVGMGSPGQIVTARGVVLRSANLPAWKNTALRGKVSAALKLPATLENDAKAAAFGEWWAGAGAGKTNKNDGLFIFTLGTGVGGGLITGGRVFHGDSDFAGEVGHTLSVAGGEPCPCGQRGCLERYCSANAVARRAGDVLASSESIRKTSSLAEIFERTGAVSAADVAAHAQAGDAFADEIWDETCLLLALACVNVCHLNDPKMIVLAGGMSKAGKFLVNRVNRHFRAQWWKMTKPTATIALARLGNNAGVIGAAGVAKEAFDRNALPAIGR